jgi:hypothetical protein
MANTRRRVLAGVGLSTAAVAVLAIAIPPLRRRLLHPLFTRAEGPYTVEQRVAELADARARVSELCRKAGFSTGMPVRVTLLGLKDEKRVEVYGFGPGDGLAKLIASYPIQAASGVLGPKLREGDRQVPEGVYPIESLNPNSRFHVALRVGYPSAFDRRMAERDGRAQLGGDIMIHGGAASIGCLAMGDPAAEELFVLAAGVGVERVGAVLSPVDLRTRPMPDGVDTSGWRGGLYDAIRAALVPLTV